MDGYKRKRCILYFCRHEARSACAPNMWTSREFSFYLTSYLSDIFGLDFICLFCGWCSCTLKIGQVQLFHGSVHVLTHPMLGLLMAPSCSLLRPRQKSPAQAALFVLVGIEEGWKGLSKINKSITSQNLSQPPSDPWERGLIEQGLRTQPTTITSRCNQQQWHQDASTNFMTDHHFVQALTPSCAIHQGTWTLMITERNFDE